MNLRADTIEVAGLGGTASAGVAVHGQVFDGVVALALHEDTGVVNIVGRIDGLTVQHAAIRFRRGFAGRFAGGLSRGRRLVHELVEVGAEHGHNTAGRAGGDVGVVVVQADNVVILAVDPALRLIHGVDDLGFGGELGLGGLGGIDLLIKLAVVDVVNAGGNAQRVDVIRHLRLKGLDEVEVVGKRRSLGDSAVHDVDVGIGRAGGEAAGLRLIGGQRLKLGADGLGVGGESVVDDVFLRHLVKFRGLAVHSDGGDLVVLRARHGKLCA